MASPSIFVEEFMIIFMVSIIVNINLSPVARTKDGRVFIKGQDLFSHTLVGYPDIPVKSVVIPMDGYVKEVDFKILHVDTLESVKSSPPFLDFPQVLSLPVLRHAEPVKTSNFPEHIVEYKGIGHGSGKSYIQFVVYSGEFRGGMLTLFRGITLEINYTFRAPMGSQKDATLDYAIITSPDFAQYFEPLKEWKNQKGIKTEIFTTDSIYSNYSGRDNQEKIRNFIKYIHENLGVGYVLLGGDVDVVPARIAFAMACEAGYHPEDEDSIRADLYYSDLDGDWDADGDNLFGEVEDSVDLIPDVHVGRCPARSGHSEDVTAFVNKIINYEKHPGTRINDALFSAMILWSNPYTDEGIAKDRIAGYLPPYMDVYRMYESIGAGGHDTVIGELNRGKGFLNHDGHGWYSGMWTAGGDYISRGDMDTLSNTTFTICFSIGCWVGAFDYDAVAEHFIRNPNGGGVAIVSNSRYGWGSPGNPGFGYSDFFDFEFFRLIFVEKELTIGDVVSDMKIKFAPLSRTENVYRWNEYELNLLGDPTMVIWHGIPDTFQVVWIDSFTLRIENNGEPVESAFVCMTGQDYYKREYTEPSGEITLEKDSLLITITKNGFIPLQINTGYRSGIVYKVFPSDTNDLKPNPGETLYIDLSVYNLSGSLMSSHTCTLSSSVLPVIDSIVYVPELQIDSDTILNHAYRIVIPDSLADGFIASLHLKGLTTCDRCITISEPLVSIERFVTYGDTVFVFLKNTGHAEAMNIERLVYASPSPLDSDTVFTVILPGTLVDTVIFPEDFAGSMRYVLTGYLVDMDTTIQVPEYHEFFTPCEDDTGFMHTGTNDLWHLSSNRGYSGTLSWYCGLDDSGYIDSMDCSLNFFNLVSTGEPVLSFTYWYEFPNYGSDGLYVILNKKASSETLDFIGSGGALLNIQDGWLPAEYNLSVTSGDTFSISFAFVSDTDGDRAEGVYLDNIRVRNVISSTPGVGEPEPGIITLKNIGGLEINLVSDADSRREYRIYDVLGRTVKQGILTLKKGNNRIYFNVPSMGLFFVRIDGMYRGRFISFGGAR